MNSFQSTNCSDHKDAAYDLPSQLLILYVECLESLIELFPIITMLRIIRVFLLNVWGYKDQKFLRLWSFFFLLITKSHIVCLPLALL
jgi:hypothetical protein